MCVSVCVPVWGAGDYTQADFIIEGKAGFD